MLLLCSTHQHYLQNLPPHLLAREQRYTRSQGFDKAVQSATFQETQPEPAQSVEGWLIIIRGVHGESSEEDIFNICADSGKVGNITVPLDRCTGFVKGYALASFKKFKSAEKAIKDINGRQHNGMRLSADWAFVSGPLPLLTQRKLGSAS